MAEHDELQRTEEPTPRRREEARKRGQVAFSQELVAAAVVLTGALCLLFLGPTAGSRLLDAVRGELSQIPHSELEVPDVQRVAVRLFGHLVSIGGLFFGLMVLAALGVSFAQVGFRIVPDRLAPDFERLSPANGFGRFVSKQTLTKAALGVLKIAVLAAVAVTVVKNRGAGIPQLSRGGIFEAVQSGWATVIRVILWLAGALGVLGLVDYVVQWRRLEVRLRMTRQELKDDVKREEGDPHVRNRIRQLQRQLAQRQMLTKVPKAIAVVTNPTHYAVALRYDRRTDRSPVVLIKGTGVFAKQIAQIARRHAIPVLERPPLARALYVVKEGQEVPPHLFQAVAEIVAFVFRLRGTT